MEKSRFAFLERRVEEEKNAKRKQWNEIQQKSPDLAATLIELKQHFGKIKLLKIEFNEQIQGKENHY